MLRVETYPFVLRLFPRLKQAETRASIELIETRLMQRPEMGLRQLCFSRIASSNIVQHEACESRQVVLTG